MSPMEAVVLLLKGMLPLRARCLQKSIMPEDASCRRPWKMSSFWRHAVVGGVEVNVVSHSSGRVIPSSVDRRE